MLTAPAKLKRMKTDPWAGYWSSKQRLSATAIKALLRL
jgi:hypothetical protein